MKPNCSIQSYVPAIHPLLAFGPQQIAVCTYQAISGAGKTLETWPEMVDNVIPFIKGEEEKSEQEPLKIWGTIDDGKIVEGEGAGDHRAVHPRAGERRSHGRGVRAVREEAGARADPLGVEGILRQAAAARSAERAEAVSALLRATTIARRRGSIAIAARARRSRSAGCAPTRSSTGSSSRSRTTPCVARQAARC